MRQIGSVVFVIKWVMCIHIRIEHIKARPNHHKSCPDDKSRVSPMRCHVRAGVLDDLDIFIVSVCRAYGGTGRIIYFRIDPSTSRRVRITANHVLTTKTGTAAPGGVYGRASKTFDFV